MGGLETDFYYRLLVFFIEIILDLSLYNRENNIGIYGRTGDRLLL